jgi:hypothetical protein
MIKPEPTAEQRQEMMGWLASEMAARHHCAMHCVKHNAKARAESGLAYLAPRTSLEGIVYELGIGMWGARLPKGMRKLANKMCFVHAAQLALNDDAFVYCEGYALRQDLGMAFHHAWVLDAERAYRVIDNTWQHPVTGVYLGIPFATDFLRHTIYAKRSYGIIDDYRRDFPVLRLPPHQFLHEDRAEIYGCRDFDVPPLPDENPWDRLEAAHEAAQKQKLEEMAR